MGSFCENVVKISIPSYTLERFCNSSSSGVSRWFPCPSHARRSCGNSETTGTFLKGYEMNHDGVNVKSKYYKGECRQNMNSYRNSERDRINGPFERPRVIVSEHISQHNFLQIVQLIGPTNGLPGWWMNPRKHDASSRMLKFINTARSVYQTG